MILYTAFTIYILTVLAGYYFFFKFLKENDKAKDLQSWIILHIYSIPLVFTGLIAVVEWIKTILQ